MASYLQKLERRLSTVEAPLCIGLDPRPEHVVGSVEDFLQKVIEETAELVAAYKPNIAYFEAMGISGYQLLEKALAYIPKEIPIVLDAKRSDIPETQKYYARAYFEGWDVDAVTLNPYLGWDSIEPFLEYEDKGVYLLALTSNPGAADLQQLPCEEAPLYQHVLQWRERAALHSGTLGFVMGLTQAWPPSIDFSSIPLLIPGLGAQGGALEEVVRSFQKTPPWLINVSRGILYAEPEKSFHDKTLTYVRRIAQSFES